MIENDHDLFYFCSEFYKEQYCGVSSKSERVYIIGSVFDNNLKISLIKF